MRVLIFLLAVGFLGATAADLISGIKTVFSKIENHSPFGDKLLTGSNGVKCFIAKHSGKALDVPASIVENGLQMIQWDFHGDANQQWRLESSSKGHIIKNVATNLVLDIKDSSFDDSAPIIQWHLYLGSSQMWSLEEGGDGYFKVRSVYTGKILDVEGDIDGNGAAIIQYHETGGDNQLWKVVDC